MPARFLSKILVNTLAASGGRPGHISSGVGGLNTTGSGAGTISASGAGSIFPPMFVTTSGVTLRRRLIDSNASAQGISAAVLYSANPLLRRSKLTALNRPAIPLFHPMSTFSEPGSICPSHCSVVRCAPAGGNGGAVGATGAAGGAPGAPGCGAVPGPPPSGGGGPPEGWAGAEGGSPLIRL